ncbi:MAG: TyeA family type III secretion system gatekeeper subunit [Janthinobacterium lividum]
MKIPFFSPPPSSPASPLAPPPTAAPLSTSVAPTSRCARPAGMQSPLRRPALLNLVRLIRATPQVRDHARLLAAARTIARQRGDPARAAAAESSDPFVQFTLLALAAGDTDGEGGAGGRRGRQGQQDAPGQGAEAVFEAALTRLDAQDPSLRARVHALNAALQSPDMLADAARCGEALDAYVAIVFQGDTLAALFEMLLARFGERFEVMRGWLMATLSAELQSGWLSREPAQMAAVRQRLYDAQTLGTLVGNARVLLTRLRRASRAATSAAAPGGVGDAAVDATRDGAFDILAAAAPGGACDTPAAAAPGGARSSAQAQSQTQSQATPQQDALELSGEVVRLCARAWPSATRFAELGQRHGVLGPPAGLLWYAGLRQMLQSLPVAVFAGPQPRQHLLDDIGQQVDRLAQEEDDLAQDAGMPGTSLPTSASAWVRIRARR